MEKWNDAPYHWFTHWRVRRLLLSALLGGLVETAQQRDHAEAIAREQDEVKTVENNIIVK